MSKGIWRDCKNQPPVVDDGELVLVDSNDKFWVGFCKMTSDGVSYFANNADPLKNDFVKYARIERLIAAESELELTRKALEIAVDALKKIGFGCGIPPDENYAYNYINIAADAHQQIQELEQKE